MRPMCAAPAVWLDDGPTMTGPMISQTGILSPRFQRIMRYEVILYEAGANDKRARGAADVTRRSRRQPHAQPRAAASQRRRETADFPQLLRKRRKAREAAQTRRTFPQIAARATAPRRRRGVTEAARSGRFSETPTGTPQSARNAAKRRTFPLFTARASISRGRRRAPARAVNSRRFARPAKREKIVFPRMQAAFGT